MAIVTAHSRLSRQVQCRFTDAQYDLLVEVANEVGRPLSAIVRDVVTLWALEHVSERDQAEAFDWTDARLAKRNAWVERMVAELNELGDVA
jgi:N-acetyl-anhydromuramyl-L-alanine amidase AmpD